MRILIKFRLKSKPRKVKKIADIVIMAGVIIILIGDWVITPIFRLLPLEMWIVLVSEVLPILFSQMWVLGIILLFFGMFLLKFNWYKGTVRISMADKAIYVTGKVSTHFEFEDLKEINIFTRDFLSQNSVRFDLGQDKISLKFKNYNEQRLFIYKLILVVKRHDNIILNNWEY